MLAIEASETSEKIINKPEPNSLKKVFNKSSYSGCESLRQFIKTQFNGKIYWNKYSKCWAIFQHIHLRN